MIVNIHNVMSNPAVSGVLDDPIRFLNNQQILFGTDSGVIVRWGGKLAH